MIHITEKSKCNGCNACIDVCHTTAISIKNDGEGFFYPVVNLSECTDCGLCDLVCPEQHVDELKVNDFEKPTCYAVHHKNLETRFDSTSGGAFSAMAEKMYKDGGYVGGAIFNDDFSVKHIISNDINDLKRLRSSKYLQSDASGIYQSVKDLLKRNEKVLVCGTPCQMAAMRRFLRKDYENLIIVDFICRGINSPKVYRKYIDSLEKKYDSKAIYIKPKNKELGWNKLTHKVDFENGSAYFGTIAVDTYMRASMVANVISRPSCYDCQFKGFPRISDITLGDFWGIEQLEKLKQFDDNVGTSMVMINSEKGKKYFESISKHLIIKEMPFEDSTRGNIALFKSLPKESVDRKAFYNDIDKMDFADVSQKYYPFTLSYKQKILRFLRLIKRVLALTRCRPRPLFQFFYLNFFHKAVHVSIKDGHAFIPTPHCVINIDKGAEVNIKGIFGFGENKFKGSRIESRMSIEKGGKLEILGNYGFGYGSNIEIFKTGHLISKGGPNSNMGTVIICQNKIVIGENVAIGRNVTIRDNNGSHVIAKRGYRDSFPVIIEDHVWLCSGCTLMSGTKIGGGAIVSANAFVISSVPAHTVVSGIPAKVTQEHIYWKL